MVTSMVLEGELLLLQSGPRGAAGSAAGCPTEGDMVAAALQRAEIS